MNNEESDNEIEIKHTIKTIVPTQEPSVIEPKKPRKAYDYVLTEKRQAQFQKAREVRAQNIELRKIEKGVKQEEFNKEKTKLEMKRYEAMKKIQDIELNKIKDATPKTPIDLTDNESVSSEEVIVKKKKKKAPKKQKIVYIDESDEEEEEDTRKGNNIIIINKPYKSNESKKEAIPTLIPKRVITFL